MSLPNILFLMSDEHRADVAGFAGDAVVRTPTLDWLARTGVVFNHAYTPSPICIPARQAIAAGQLPRTCACERYGQDLPPFAMTFARRFTQHAYLTACCGKLHHSGEDQMQGWLHRPAGDLEVQPNFMPGRVEALFERYGKRPGTKWSDAKETLRAGVAPGPYQAFDEAAVAAAGRTIRQHFLDPYYDRPAPLRPLLLKVSMIQPHYPYFTSEDKFTYYLNRVTPYRDQPVFDHPFLSQRQVTVGVDGVTERDLRRATAAYYGMVETIDDHYATVLDQLRHAGQDLDDWIIVYCSDHGEMLGEHGIWEKQKFFEGSARVPLIIRWPKRFAPRVVEENVNLCDLFATLCDLAGIDLPADEATVRGAGLDSRSLVPLMQGDCSEWANETVSQFRGSNLMIKRDALKYQFYEADDCASQPEVLFDLERDPAERVNVIDEPGYAAAVAAFRHRRAALGFGPDAPAYRNAGYHASASLAR
ncbi:MAG: sulfatase-like hydrolase/transferase [Phycisphaeraceae bacterium]